MTEIVIRNKVSKLKLKEALSNLKSMGIDAIIKTRKKHLKSGDKTITMNTEIWKDRPEVDTNLREKAWNRN